MGYTCGKRWTNELIIKELYNVINALKIKRMPSAREMNMITGNSALSNKINKTGGFYKWAKDLKLTLKESETQFGKEFETVAIKIITDKGYKVKRMTNSYPFDLLVNDNISIDVKAARAYCNKGSRVHTVGINKKYSACDIYLIFLLDEKKSIERTLIVPGNELKLTSLNLGRDSKYNKYIDRWDLIKKYDMFYKQLA